MAPALDVVIDGAVAVPEPPLLFLVDGEGATSQTEAVSTPENMRICTDHSVLLSMLQE